VGLVVAVLVISLCMAAVQYYKKWQRQHAERLVNAVVRFDADQHPFDHVRFKQLSVPSSGGELAECRASGWTSFTVKSTDIDRKVAIVTLERSEGKSSCIPGEPLTVPINIIERMVEKPEADARLHARAEKERLELLKKAQGN
jgi:hypothetical protein